MCENQGLITELLTDFHMVTPLKKDGRVKGSVLEKVKMKNLDECPEKKNNKNKNEVKEDDGGDSRTRSVNESEKCFVRKRLRDSSNGSLTDSDKNALASPKRKKGHYELETDPVVLARRQKQIDYGKNTIGYDRYVQAIPKKERKKHHPRTPPKHFKYSRRAWDGMVKVWRQQLHFWDEPNEDNDSRKQSRQTNSDCEEQALDDSLPPDEGKAAK